MNVDLLRASLSRRGVLKAGAAGTVLTALPSEAHATSPDDVPFDYADPANLRDWAPSRYGPRDQRGTLNEVTPAKTARVLRQTLDANRPVKTYNLGALMWSGFPTMQPYQPERRHELKLLLGGYPAPPGFGGHVAFDEPFGANKLSVHEERFEASNTFQIGSQLDGLNHVGAAGLFYNGFRGQDIARDHGTAMLGSEHTGPIVTKGILLDVVGVKAATGQHDALGPPAANGQPVLKDNYRITVEDIKQAMEFGHIERIDPGDAVLLRTGWTNLLARRDPAELARWGGSGGMPGIYLREARYLARFRPVLIGSDTWTLEVMGNPVNNDGAVIPVHQELLMRHGIRIAESYVLDQLAADRVHEFVFIVTPQFVEGATCGNTPPAALGQP
ncbi:cyclase [Actinosynnema sp. ALI-1.44]|uniref:cyclase family protein n=1 Tax=Actinosynnema sp. ALI-1.44 TaxID=1933779 RepID=UPI00097BB9F4|nr:cyclase family protein [Actinosynnema sp. ALI-1.44]ONI74786.1 cyclase [Actinosynnema sp. ALI-1.44]